MFPTTNNGQNTTLATQPTQGDNSLTTYFRSLSNQLGTTGAGAFNTGAGVFGQGVNYSATPQNTFSQASGALDPAQAYWNNILAGGPGATAAVAPYASMVGQNYANAANTAATTMPRGGYASTVSATLPFAQARDVNNSLLQLQPQAAQQLNTIAGTRAGIGQGQSGLVQLLLQSGLGQEGLGSNMLQQALQAVLQKNGINVTESGQNKALAGQLGSSAMGTGADVYKTTQAYPSDIRIKEFVSKSEHALEDVLRIGVYDYNFIGHPQRETGVMAQELNEILPSAVIPGDDHNIWRVEYAKLVPLLVSAIQQQQRQIEELRAKVEG